MQLIVSGVRGPLASAPRQPGEEMEMEKLGQDKTTEHSSNKGSSTLPMTKSVANDLGNGLLLIVFQYKHKCCGCHGHTFKTKAE